MIEYERLRTQLAKTKLELANLQRDYEALWQAADLACVSMEERGYGDMPSFTHLRAVLASKEQPHE
jgi:hypothetical protein